jgi:hypothetical protein
MPAREPIAMAIPPTITIRRLLLMNPTLETLALIRPKISRAIKENIIEIGSATLVCQKMYGERGMNPEMKYEKNIIIPETILRRLVWSSPLRRLSAEVSDKKLPAAIENASANIKTTPVRNIVSLGTSATAIPDKRPTVETKLSSTPKTKFLK